MTHWIWRQSKVRVEKTLVQGPKVRVTAAAKPGRGPDELDSSLLCAMHHLAVEESMPFVTFWPVYLGSELGYLCQGKSHD